MLLKFKICTIRFSLIYKLYFLSEFTLKDVVPTANDLFNERNVPNITPQYRSFSLITVHMMKNTYIE